MKNLQVVGVNTVFGFSAALGAAVVACVIAVAYAQANEHVPDVASISAASGVPLVSDDVLIVAGFPAFLSVPEVVGFPAVAFIPAVDGISTVAVVPVLMASLLLLASLCYCSWYLYVLYYTMRHIGHRTIRLRLSDCHFFLLSNYRISYWQIRIKATIYRTIGYRTHKKLSVAHLCCKQ